MPGSVFINGIFSTLENKYSPDAADSPAPAIAMMFFDEANVSRNAVNMAPEGVAIDDTMAEGSVISLAAI